MQQDSRRNSGASSSLSTLSPSFNSYSSENIADIAARVIHELNISHDDHYDDDFYPSIPSNDTVLSDNVDDDNDNDNSEDNDDESEFEFAVLCNEDTSSPISADEIFCNGQIKPVYPVFGSYDHKSNDAVLETKTASLRLPLRKLMSQDSSSSASSSSEDAAELEGVPPETYCVWAPPTTNNKKKNVVDNLDTNEEITMMKKKSNSTGTTTGSSTSKRWRFKDLLHRSHSDGKDTFVFLTPAQNNNSKKVTALNGKYSGDKKTEEVKMVKKNKKKSYLQYTPDVVGFFGNVNGINRTIRPF